MIKDLYKYRGYIFYSTRAKLISEIIQNHLGFLWWIFDPLLKMVVYYSVFVYLLHRGTEDFVSFLIVGIVAFTWFSNTVMQGANSINSARGLMQQVHFPKIITPTIVFFAKTFRFIIVMLVVMAFLGIKNDPFLTWFAVPAVIISQALLTYGTSLMVASIVPFIPDVLVIVPYILQAMLFASGVFFQIKPDDPNYDIFMLNPMAKILEQYREVLLYNHWPSWKALVIIAISGIFLSIVISFVIKKLDRFYPRVVK